MLASKWFYIDFLTLIISIYNMFGYSLKSTSFKSTWWKKNDYAGWMYVCMWGNSNNKKKRTIILSIIASTEWIGRFLGYNCSFYSCVHSTIQPKPDSFQSSYLRTHNRKTRGGGSLAHLVIASLSPVLQMNLHH